ncbi:MAG: type II toxin-antitoxin system VapC family toxin [Actinomycetales bacterium]|jgi:ribonuclease VapC|nr:type II toxin-antitoxin system VapC family toxin [Candidatus Phosphoribacter baldrii]MBK6953967.1 type II toxin-antitoxin system VapC family toxin [Candidatus Phosphoribacter baldrii]MBK7611064.1 type II toxin-antitoxin system VapC family toxin [Candidatus Phosphoribacter baldrii]HRC13982.1 type II toxin-antitoxin system VapC family toxin [Dermatophilaceae bacterium]
MIVDSSAIMAILNEEPEAEACLAAIRATRQAKMSAATFLECALVVDGYGRVDLSADLEPMVERLGITVVPVSVEQVRLGRVAHQRFGRGSGHPARLNLGDCFAYALAKDTGEPLLYKGDDFVHTDVRSVFPRGDVDGGSEAT